MTAEDRCAIHICGKLFLISIHKSTSPVPPRRDCRHLSISNCGQASSVSIEPTIVGNCRVCDRRAPSCLVRGANRSSRCCHFWIPHVNRECRFVASKHIASHRVRLGRPPFKPPINSNPNGSSGNTAHPPCPPPLKSTSSHDHLADTMSDRRNSVPSCRMPRSGEAFEKVVRRKSCAAAEKRGRY